MDYNEIICTAIDTIVSAKMEGLQYDITKLCLIEDDSKAKQGKYVVSDGAVRFEAFTSDETLKNGNQVQVIIPNGDYNKQKMIIGRVVADDTTPFKYVSPLDTMVIITDNIFEGAPAVSLLANETSMINNVSYPGSYEQVYNLVDATNFAGFTRLGISADFSTSLEGLNIVSGTYGLRAQVTTDVGVYDFDLTTKDMYGNPYGLEGFFSQEKVFSLEGINSIKSIDLYFFQSGNFKNDLGQLINYDNSQDEDIEVDPPIENQDNLFVQNVKIFLGYDSGEFEDDTLRIFTDDKLTFKYDNTTIVKNLGLRWIHKEEKSGFFKILKDEDLSNNEFEITWYQYDENFKNIKDEYAGFGWKKIKSMAEENLTFKLEEMQEKLENLRAQKEAENNNIQLNDYISELNQIIDYYYNSFLLLAKDETELLNSLKDFQTNTFNNDVNQYFARVEEIKQDYSDSLETLTSTSMEGIPGEENNSFFKCKAYLNHQNQKEEFKVIGIQHIDIGEDKPQKKVLKSSILTFNNEIPQANQVTKEAVSALQIVCDDQSDGNYFIYDQNGAIINSGDGSGRERFFKAEYKGAEITNSLGNIDYIKWWIPINNSMVITTETWNELNEGICEVDTPVLNGVQYQVITRKTAVDGNLNSVYQSYAIGGQWYQEKANNTIKCVLSVDGVEYEAVKELKFGKAGTNGTNFTFFLQYENGQNAILGKKNSNPIVIGAELYDSAGRNIGFSKAEAKQISWKWLKPINYYNFVDAGELDNLYMEIYQEDEGGKLISSSLTKKEEGQEEREKIVGSSVKIRYLKDEIPEENYYILSATFQNDSAKYPLTAYLPIAIKKKESSHIEGAKEVIYNSQGIPSYYSDAYVLYEMSEGFTGINNLSELKDPDFEFTEEQVKKIEGYRAGSSIRWYLEQFNTNTWKIKEGYLNDVTQIIRKIDDEADYVENFCDWKLVTSEDTAGGSGLITGYIPSLKKLKDNHYALCASSFYTRGYNDEVCVYAYREMSNGKKDIFWSQPILIHQSQYDFSMLNKWDGQLTIDDENGTIMSKMLGAGKKNDDNTFSGVLIGDVRAGTGNNVSTDPGTGIYGMHHGTWSFGLKEDGTAFIGKAGRGQIRLNGNTSTISSASFEEEAGTGMNIDLDDGIFQVQVNGEDRIYMSPGFNVDKIDLPYFQIVSKNKSNLIYMDEDDYYLQSDNYTDYNGMKIDLANGSIITTRGQEIEENGLTFIEKEGSVLIQPDTPFFQVKKGDKNLIYMGADDGYYFQSFDYVGHGIDQAINDEDKLVYSDGTFNEGIRYISFDGSTIYINNLVDGNYIKTDQKHPCHTNPILLTDSDYIDAENQWKADPENEGQKAEEHYEEIKNTVLSQRFNKVKDARAVVLATKGSGLKIDLNNGVINGYQLYLKASNKDNPDARYVLIDGGAASPTATSSGGWPFMIGTNFKVDWDGHLTCNNIEYIGAGNQSIGGKHININDQFLINYDGSGTWWRGSVGYAQRAKVAESIKGFENLQNDIVDLKASVASLKSHKHYADGKLTGPAVYDDN